MLAGAESSYEAEGIRSKRPETDTADFRGICVPQEAEAHCRKVSSNRSLFLFPQSSLHHPVALCEPHLVDVACPKTPSGSWWPPPAGRRPSRPEPWMATSHTEDGSHPSGLIPPKTTATLLPPPILRPIAEQWSTDRKSFDPHPTKPSPILKNRKAKYYILCARVFRCH